MLISQSVLDCQGAGAGAGAILVAPRLHRDCDFEGKLAAMLHDEVHVSVFFFFFFFFFSKSVFFKIVLFLSGTCLQ